MFEAHTLCLVEYKCSEIGTLAHEPQDHFGILQFWGFNLQQLVRINITCHHTAAKMFMTLSLPSEIYLNMRKHARSLTDILEPMLDLSMTEEGLPATSCSILIFKTYAHPASLLQCFLCCYKTFNFSRFTGELDHFSCCDTPTVTLHGIMARFEQVFYIPNHTAELKSVDLQETCYAEGRTVATCKSLMSLLTPLIHVHCTVAVEEWNLCKKIKTIRNLYRMKCKSTTRGILNDPVEGTNVTLICRISELQATSSNFLNWTYEINGEVRTIDTENPPLGLSIGKLKIA
ncbi:hypothetical protein DAPPUDRAFT_325508 [Daphnia pulex]|uniref:Uncharacterized protein n=1 Tax=Daphnia pulex TaxID=6669 RepID=E9H4X7_DAPPU|nr:hypothetical protein DAPPUDRAFT_325508 [Daphnia pulex]|eukprot:EFX73219.1 hypothetical protein DAPPUDRAFT_325508 [Daphnia pulex]